jgi:hypothetical protein
MPLKKQVTESVKDPKNTPKMKQENQQIGMEEPPNTFPNLNILSVFVIYWLFN